MAIVPGSLVTLKPRSQFGHFKVVSLDDRSAMARIKVARQGNWMVFEVPVELLVPLR